MWDWSHCQRFSLQLYSFFCCFELLKFGVISRILFFRSRIIDLQILLTKQSINNLTMLGKSSPKMLAKKLQKKPFSAFKIWVEKNCWKTRPIYLVDDVVSHQYLSLTTIFCLFITLLSFGFWAMSQNASNYYRRNEFRVLWHWILSISKATLTMAQHVNGWRSPGYYYTLGLSRTLSRVYDPVSSYLLASMHVP